MAWLFVPGLAASSSVSSWRSPTTAPSVTWRGKPMPPRHWLRVWPRVSWLRRLSGTTLSPSMADAGVDAWISSLPASPASRGRAPAKARAPQTSDGSGLTSGIALAKYSPGWSGWRMCLPLFPEEDWPSFSGTWPVSGSMQSGVCSEQPTLAPPIDASACTSWPTAVVQDAIGSARHTTTTGVMHAGMMLTDAIQMWRTPDSPNAGGPRNRQTSIGHGHQVTIAEQAEHWPTPLTADVHGTREADGKRNTGLNTHAQQWPTPSTAQQNVSSTQADERPRPNGKTLADASMLWPTPVVADHWTPSTEASAEREAGKHNLRGAAIVASEDHWPTP